MLKEVTLPEISENVDSGEVIAVLVSVGAVVEKDQPVVELETEKAAFEVPSPEKGRIAEIDVKVGQTVKVGEVLIKLQTDGELAAAGPKPQEKRPAEPPVIAEVVEELAALPPPEEVEPERPAPQEQQPVKAEPERPASAVPVAAAPSVRLLARELGIDIAKIPGSGSGGRITPEDVKQYARGIIGGDTASPRAPGGAGTPNARSRVWGPAPVEETVRPLPDLSQWGGVERQPMSKTRRTIADTLSYGWSHIPHVTQYDRADITDLESFRKAHAAEVEKAGGKLSVTSIVVKVAASALKVFPQFNASLDTQRDEIVYRKYCHIAVAVDTDRGLLVPVIRDVDKKSILQVSVELAQLAAKARNKQIAPEELMGGGFTVSNLGGLGGTNFSPVIYWPQVAILGISRSAWEAVPWRGRPGLASRRHLAGVSANEGQGQDALATSAIQERLILPLSLSYDHRVIDGAEGARFLHWIAQALEQPLLMIL
jgi:pyruvate dehydrogenase E2 component (dihydrolipoamide acetyltransferase)